MPVGRMGRRLRIVVRFDFVGRGGHIYEWRRTAPVDVHDAGTQRVGEPLLYRTANRWDKQREAGQVREHARRNQHNAGQNDERPIEHGVGGHRSGTELGLNARQRFDALTPGKPCTEEAGDQHQRKRRSNARSLGQLYEQCQLHERNDGKNEQQSKQHHTRSITPTRRASRPSGWGGDGIGSVVPPPPRGMRTPTQRR